MTKKIIGGLALVVLTLVLFTSCLSFLARVLPDIPINKRVFDESIPDKKTATVLFLLDVTEFNGVDVYREWYEGKYRSGLPQVKIPAGDADIAFNAYVSLRGAIGKMSETYTFKDVPIKYHFDAGKEYTIERDFETKPTKRSAREEGTYGINIYEGLQTHPNKRDRIDYFVLFETEDACK